TILIGNIDLWTFPEFYDPYDRTCHPSFRSRNYDATYYECCLGNVPFKPTWKSNGIYRYRNFFRPRSRSNTYWMDINEPLLEIGVFYLFTNCTYICYCWSFCIKKCYRTNIS